jgi:DNA-binding transcriptional LysR family regulator
MIDPRQIECFLSVSHTLHFSRSAQELHLAQPTVSESIRRLEKELGGELFDRTTRRVVLTDLGRMFIPEAKAALAALSGAMERGRAFAAQRVTELFIGYSYGLDTSILESIAQLQRTRPDLIISLRGRSTPRLMRMVRERHLDAAFCVMPERDAELDSCDMGAIRLVALMPDDHPFAQLNELALVDLVSEPLIAWPRAANPALYDQFARAMDDTGEPWTLVGTAVGAANVASRVLAGFGVGVLFEAEAAANPLPGVTSVVLGAGMPAIDRKLVWRSRVTDEGLLRFIEAVGLIAAGD